MQGIVARTDSLSKSINIVFLVMRFIMGGLMLEAGLHKLLSGSFSAAGFLSHATGPFAGFFIAMGQNPAMLNAVNWLVPWGELLIGLALILGGAVRLASISGIIMMALFYLAALPPDEGWISQAIVFIAMFAVLMVPGTGYYLGLDSLFVKLENQRSPLRFLLG